MRVLAQVRVVVQKASVASAVKAVVVTVVVQPIRVVVKVVASVTAMHSVQPVIVRHVIAMTIVVTVPMHRVANSHAVTVHGSAMAHRVTQLLRRVATIAVMVRAVTATAVMLHQHHARHVNPVKQTAVQTNAHVVTIRVLA